MTYTPQMEALNTLKSLYSHNSKVWTEDHVHYRRVGVVLDSATFNAMGDSWVESIESLLLKATTDSLTVNCPKSTKTLENDAFKAS